tara:strand:- start:249 stop:857 length:609 start_codon:yes stop_codon:yes gene_type:complete
MIGLINANSGNLGSLINAFKFLNIKIEIIENSSQIKKFQKIILPGVGTFNNLKKNLISNDLFSGLNDFINNDKNFFLGICIGMQILLTKGTEDGETEGFNFFKGDVVNFKDIKEIKTPNINWLNIQKQSESKILNNINDLKFYFLHSYFCHLEDKQLILAKANYKGIEFPSIIKKNNIYGIQFHPEKSRSQGLNILKNFANL